MRSFARCQLISTLSVITLFCILPFVACSSDSRALSLNDSSISASLPSSSPTTLSSSSKPYRVHDSEHGHVTAPASISFHGAVYTRSDLIGHEELLKTGTEDWYIHVVGALVCVTIAALAAGLTVGLVSIDPFDLAVIQSTEESDCSTQEEIEELRQDKIYAERLLPLVTKHHLLLVTLLIMNACANEVLPLLLDNLVPSWMAVALSVGFVLLFGEILPSSIFTGSSQLRLAASMTPLVWFFITVLFPLAWPIAWILDRALGVEDDSRLRRSELKSLIRLQANRATSGASQGSNGSGQIDMGFNSSPSESPSNGLLGTTTTPTVADKSSGLLSYDEMNILHGVLEASDRTVQDAMVPIDEVFMLSVDTKLDLNQMAWILHQGHSRIPIYEGSRQNIRGVLLVKRLIVVNPEDGRQLRTIATRWPLICSPQMPCLDVLNLFQTGRSHMAIIADNPELMMTCLRQEKPVPSEVRIRGIITLEDVLELILKEEISDETDFGVRDLLEHSTLVRKRIERLKILAAATKKEAMIGTIAAASTRRHTRTTSIARALSSKSLHSLAPSPKVALQRSPSFVLPTSAASTPSAPSETSQLMSPSRATSYASFQTVDEVKVTIGSGGNSAVSSTNTTFTMDDSTSSASTTPRISGALPRDETFSRPVRSSTLTGLPARTTSAPHALPPLPSASMNSSAISTIVEQHNTHSPRLPVRSHTLTPRALRSADALQRKDLDAETLSMLKQIQDHSNATSATASANSSASASPYLRRMSNEIVETPEERARLMKPE